MKNLDSCPNLLLESAEGSLVKEDDRHSWSEYLLAHDTDWGQTNQSLMLSEGILAK